MFVNARPLKRGSYARLLTAASCVAAACFGLTVFGLTAPSASAQDAVAVATHPDARHRKPRDIYDAYHPWQAPATLAEWDVEADRIRRQILVSNGLWPLPEKTPLAAVVHGKVERDGYTVERVFFRSRPGHYVTGSLYRPLGVTGKVPGVLCPHGHWENGRFYDGEKGVQGQLDSGAEEFPNAARYPLQARMAQLARMGCVVFFYDMIGYADSQPLDHRTGFNDAQSELWLHNLMGLQTWNSIRALDFLESLPDVDPQRLAITGASGGGTQTMILGAIDPRVAVAFPAVMVSTGMQGGCVCENASYMRIDVNNIAFAALFAPRPQAMSGADDWTIEIETKGLPELKQIYGLYDKPELVHAKCFPQFTHNYNQPAREMMYDWLNQHLQLGIEGPVKQTDFVPLSRAEATVFTEDYPRPDDSLTAAQLRELMVAEDLARLEHLLTAQPDQYREIASGALQVMLSLPIPATSLQTEAPAQQGSWRLTRGNVETLAGARIPVLRVQGENTSSGRLYWFHHEGTQHLFEADGTLQPEVQKLLTAGFEVVTADLYQTGTAVNASDEVRKPVDARFPGYTYCYNRPLLSERVRDLIAVVTACSQADAAPVTAHLIGSGDAGVWTLLARCVLTQAGLTGTLVDLQGFHFGGVTEISDPNLLPGALKYGDLSGLARLISNAPLHLYRPHAAAEWQQRLSQNPGLQLKAEPLTPAAVMQTLVKN